MHDDVQQHSLPFSDFMGVKLVAATRDTVIAEMLVTEQLCTRPAVLHGGAAMALADTVGAIGAALNLPEGRATTTIESKTNFIAPVPVGSTVRAEAIPIHRGKRTMIWQTRITLDNRFVALVA